MPASMRTVPYQEDRGGAAGMPTRGVAISTLRLSVRYLRSWHEGRTGTVERKAPATATFRSGLTASQRPVKAFIMEVQILPSEPTPGGRVVEAVACKATYAGSIPALASNGSDALERGYFISLIC